MDSSIENAEEMERIEEAYKDMDIEDAIDSRDEFFKKLMRKEWRRKERMKKGGR